MIKILLLGVIGFIALVAKGVIKVDTNMVQGSAKEVLLSMSNFFGVSMEVVVWGSLGLFAFLFFSSFLKIFEIYKKGMIIASMFVAVPSTSYFVVILQSFMK